MERRCDDPAGPLSPGATTSAALSGSGRRRAHRAARRDGGWCPGSRAPTTARVAAAVGVAYVVLTVAYVAGRAARRGSARGGSAPAPGCDRRAREGLLLHAHDHDHGDGTTGYLAHVVDAKNVENLPFWDKHFAEGETASIAHLSDALFLEFLGDAVFRLPRARAREVAPFFDTDGDGAVMRSEFEAFKASFLHGPSSAAGVGGLLRNIGSGGSSVHDELRGALQAIAKLLADRHGGGDGGSGGGKGCALWFDRDEKEYLELSESGDLQFPGAAAFTLEAWVRPRRRAETMTVISKYNRGKWGQYVLRLEPAGTGGAAFDVVFHREVAPWGHRSSATVPSDAFTHVAATYGDGWSRIFLNGTEQGAQKEGPQDTNPETPVLIGAVFEKGEPVSFVDGAVDDVRVWRVARTQEQLRASMHVQLTGSEEGLSGYWTFDECVGQRAKDTLGLHDGEMRGGVFQTSPLEITSYTAAFGCVDSLC